MKPQPLDEYVDRVGRNYGVVGDAAKDLPVRLDRHALMAPGKTMFVMRYIRGDLQLSRCMLG